MMRVVRSKWRSARGVSPARSMEPGAMMRDLRELVQMRRDGFLSEDEFAAAKAVLLPLVVGSTGPPATQSSNE